MSVRRDADIDCRLKEIEGKVSVIDQNLHATFKFCT